MKRITQYHFSKQEKRAIAEYAINGKKKGTLRTLAAKLGISHAGVVNMFSNIFLDMYRKGVIKDSDF